MTHRRHNVAIVQLHTKPLDMEGNFSRACEFIRQAANQGAEVVVLPEYHLNGYLPEDPEYVLQTANCKEYLDRYCALAEELQVCIVPGTFVERHETTVEDSPPGSTVLSDERGYYSLFNTAYFISHDGSIRGSYQKRNQWHTERSHQSRGRSKHSVIDSPIGKVGLLICWDLAFPEAFRELVQQGADVIIVPTCWTVDESYDFGLKLNPDYERLLLDSMITTRSFENTCAVVFANAGGPSEAFIGLSQVTMPFAGPVARLADSSEGLLLAEIDTEILREAELNYKVREDLASEGYPYAGA